MKREEKPVRALLAIALALTLQIGCSGGPSPANAVPVYVVSGKLTYQTKPMSGAVITFHEPSHAKTARGTADAEGNYKLTTYVTDDGAAEGDYVVTIHWPDPNYKPPADEPDPPLAPDLLKNFYTDKNKTTLKATVKKEPTSIDFALPQ